MPPVLFAGKLCGYCRSLRCWWLISWSDESWLYGLVVGVVTPVGLEKDGVDVAEVDGFGLVASGFDKGSQAEVFGGS